MKVMYFLIAVLIMGILPFTNNHDLRSRLPINLKGLFIKPYERNYLKSFDISELRRYSEIQAINRNKLIKETLDKKGWITLHYEGYKITFESYGILANLRITSPNYRFGRMKIGVGSTYNEVKRAYRFQYKIKDTEVDELGFIDGDTSNFDGISTSPWISFRFDSEKKVGEITILPYGGP